MKGQRAYGSQNTLEEEDKEGREKKKKKKVGELSQPDSKAHYSTIVVKIVWTILMGWTNRPTGYTNQPRAMHV